jgi:DNA-binding NarL/FixJ family response regulator
MTILEEQGIAVVGHCDNVASLESLVEENPDAVIITDLAIDEVPFQDLVKRLRGKSTNCKIVVYSMREAPGTIGLCYDAGVQAFVPKRSATSELVQAVEHANRGERYLPPSVATALAQFHIDAKVPINLL